MFRLELLPECGSTNDEIKQRVANGSAVEGLAIRALRQTAGRGRMGRQWQSDEGNLMLSVWLMPRRPAAEWATLSLMAAVSLHRALGALAVDAEAVRIKWPNDLLLKAGGNYKKLSGMLLEGMKEGVILGVGVNITRSPAEALYPAVSLHEAGYMLVTAEQVTQAFLTQLSEDYAVWQEEGFAAFHSAWRGQAFARGERITASLPQARYEGVFEDITEDGVLLLREEDGSIRQVTMGDVFA